MDKTRVLFAKNILQRREALGFNQEDVADLLGINTRTYQKYEYGKAYPRPEKMAKLASILESTVSELTSERSSSAKTSVPRAQAILEIQNKLMSMPNDDFEKLAEMVAKPKDYKVIAVKQAAELDEALEQVNTLKKKLTPQRYDLLLNANPADAQFAIDYGMGLWTPKDDSVEPSTEELSPPHRARKPPIAKE